jgi:hypothetical protein
MERKRVKLAVYVDLDPVPGTFHSAESAQNTVRRLLKQSIPHYNPLVSIESYDTEQQKELQS